MSVLLFLLSLSAQPGTAAFCVLTEADLAANRALSFEAFDQHGATPATARELANRSCFAEAVRANLDYLARGPVLSDYHRNVVRFHTGQYLAKSGDEKAAAAVIAGTRTGPNPDRPTFDWDSYVTGTYAFLIKDRPLLDAMAAKLTTSADEGNKMNGKVLKRMQKCWGKSYAIAYGTDPVCD